MKGIVTLGFISGWRTYLSGAILIILAGLHAQGYIGDSAYTWSKDAVLGGGLMALRAALAVVKK